MAYEHRKENEIEMKNDSNDFGEVKGGNGEE